MDFMRHFLTFYKIGGTVVVTYPRANSSKTKQMFSDRYGEMQGRLGVHQVREFLDLQGRLMGPCHEIIFLVRDHYERVLSNYYAFVVGGDPSKENSRMYGEKGSFQDFVNNLSVLIDRDILEDKTEHYAPYTKLHTACGIPVSLLCDNFRSWAWPTSHYVELFDYLQRQGFSLDREKLKKPATGIRCVDYLDVQRDFPPDPHYDDPHLLSFRHWQNVEKKYPSSLMYTPEMEIEVMRCYQDDLIFPLLHPEIQGD